MPARLLGPNDEPQKSGTIVAVNYGDYRRQCVFVNSGANIGCWYPLGNEFGHPKTWDDPRSQSEKMFDRGPVPQRPAGTLPLHPHWEDVVALGPVTLLTPGDDDAYRTGWRNGRRDLWQRMEDLTYDEPEGANQ